MNYWLKSIFILWILTASLFSAGDLSICLTCAGVAVITGGERLSHIVCFTLVPAYFKINKNFNNLYAINRINPQNYILILWDAFAILEKKKPERYPNYLLRSKLKGMWSMIFFVKSIWFIFKNFYKIIKLILGEHSKYLTSWGVFWVGFVLCQSL